MNINNINELSKILLKIIHMKESRFLLQFAQFSQRTYFIRILGVYLRILNPGDCYLKFVVN